ncbi:hypothetical protein FKP32DRAFT_1180884 [Trametes sanguinea]|nr:hypothetical protein FKP32DRAFT_1180884 [Trametes sanguinea]
MYQSFAFNDYLATAALALLLYYQLSTAGQMLRCCSTQRTTGALILYWLNKFLPLLYIAYAAPFWPVTFQRDNCVAEDIFHQVLENLQYLPWAGEAEDLGYASVPHFTIACVHQCCCLPLAVLQDKLTAGMCVDRLIPSRPDYIALLARLPLIAADLAVLLITWTTQFKSHKGAQSLKKSNALATIMLENGTVYFIALVSLNIAQVVRDIQGFFTGVGKNEGGSFLTYLAEPITAILVDCFLNDLHNAAEANTHQESLSSMGTLEFRVVGSIAATLSGSHNGVGGEDAEPEGDNASVELNEEQIESAQLQLGYSDGVEIEVVPGAPQAQSLV